MGKDGKRVRGSREKVELLDFLFCICFYMKGKRLQPDKGSIVGDEREMLVKIGKELGREYLAALSEFTFSGLDDLYPWVLQELADMLSETLNKIFESSGAWGNGQRTEKELEYILLRHDQKLYLNQTICFTQTNQLSFPILMLQKNKVMFQR